MASVGERKAFERGFIAGYFSEIYLNISTSDMTSPKLIWFNKGVVDDSSPLGDVALSHQESGIMNVDTFRQDGYIYHSYNATSGYLTFTISPNIVPRGLFKSVTIEYEFSTVPRPFYQPFIGLFQNRNNTKGSSEFVYSEQIPLSATRSEFTYDLTNYNNSGSDMYLHIGGGVKDMYVYRIELEYF